MISSALSSVTDELNQFIKLKFQLSDDRVLLSNLMNLDGSVAVKEINNLTISVININEDKVAYSKSKLSPSIGEKLPVYLNVYVLVGANFDSKRNKEALRFLSAAVSFFQQKKVFTPSDTPSLDGSIDKIIFEIVNLDFKEISSIFGALGSKYMPSIVYKMRMVCIEEEVMTYSAGEMKERGMGPREKDVIGP